MSKSHPDHVMRTDQTIVAWDDVPVAIQKKILNGTMTEEDWDSDWSAIKTQPKRSIEDVVNTLLTAPVAKVSIGPRHVHVFRKEYPKCLIKGCNARKNHSPV